MLYYVYKNYLTYIWIKFTVFLRENCAEQGANKAVFDALFVLSFAQDVSWNIFLSCSNSHLRRHSFEIFFILYRASISDTLASKSNK